MISLLANCWAYVAGVIAPIAFFGRCWLYSRRQRSISVRACSSVGNQCSLRHSSRSRPLKDSPLAFWFGVPGWNLRYWLPL
ncbi:hypothetical protein BXO8_09010, partial [Xanthomonas oryzae pv. oryzae]